MIKRNTNKDLISLLEKEQKDIKLEKEQVSSKLFPYELKGLDDWKKYLRGKFFEEEKIIVPWYKMVSYLNGNRTEAGHSYKTMVDIVKSILY